MKITVKLFNILQSYGSEKEEKAVPEDTTVRDVIGILKIPPETPLLKIVNGVHVKTDYKLKEGDVLAFFPPIAGG
jgi:molybdopterin converting factor small subunit